MPFPETITELAKAGYKFLNDGTCRGCGQQIEWWETPRGKKMPMDVSPDGDCEAHWGTCPNRDQFKKK